MRYYIILFLSIGTIFTTMAQRNGIGIHGGVTASGTYDLTNGYDDTVDPGNGFLAGLRYNVKFGPIGLCAEVNYSNITYNYPRVETIYSGFGYTYTYINSYGGDVSLNYLSIPILAKLYIGGFNLQAGMQASSLLSGRYNENYPAGVEQYIPVDIQDPWWNSTINGIEYWDWEDMDIAAVFGVGIDTKLGLYASWRGTVSITPTSNIDLHNAGINSYGTDWLFGSTDLLRRVISSQMSVGYKF